MGSSGSKGGAAPPNDNHNVKANKALKSPVNVKREVASGGEPTTTTTLSNEEPSLSELKISAKDTESERNGRGNEVVEFGYPCEDVTFSPKVENKTTLNDWEEENGNTSVQVQGSKPKSKKQNFQKVQKLDSDNLLEFIDSSDESDSDIDSIFGHSNTNLPKERSLLKQSKQEQAVKANAISLPLPAPSNQPNHANVFEQEKALNEYNRQHGYTALSVQPKQVSQRITSNYDDHTKYPESYAQKVQRGNYQRDPNSIVREKTIYRNPDDWDLEESIVQNFDAERFKAANAAKKTEDKAEDQGDSNDDPYELDRFVPKFSALREKGPSPKYNTADEDLMADIEKEFDL